MRLGQLSRKLDISTSEIGTLLADEFGLTIGDHPNIKVDDDHAKFVIEKFQKNVAEKLDSIDEGEAINKEKYSSIENVESNIDIDNEGEFLSDPDVEEKEEIETIRVKAAKLDGLTVVDKIELPEPPPPEMVEIDGVMYDKAELKKQRIAERKERDAQRRKEAAKRAADRKLRSNKSSKKNKKEISFAEKRILEEKQESDQKKQEERRKRYRQKKHYESKHKIHKTTTLKPEKKVKVSIEKEEILIETPSEPKTLLGKFWRWINTY